MMPPGTVVDAKYRLERILGRGGMGMVIEARHVQLGTPVALKFLRKGIIDGPSLTERFLREARATAAMTSEHVCRVFDVGTFDGVPYLVMERLEGRDLANLLRQRHRLPASEACGYLIQACAGLAEAHAAQIVHRDLKPGNLFLTSRPDGTPLVKVLDFGIAKAPSDGDADLTGTNAVLGSPAYMSLEQLRSSKLVDPRSDIWSLGVILFEMIAGRRPFAGDTVADLALKIAMEPTPRLPDGFEPLDAIISRCLARDPAHRYPDVAALSRALAPIAADRSPTLRGPPVVGPVMPGSDAAVHEPATTALSSGAIETPTPVRESRMRITVLGVLAAAAVLGASLGVAVTRGEAGDPPAPPAHGVAPEASPAPRPPPPRPAPSAVPPVAAAMPAAVPDAGVDASATEPKVEPEVEPEIEPEVEPEIEIGAPRPATPARASPPRPRPRPPKRSTDELGKSRI